MKKIIILLLTVLFISLIVIAPEICISGAQRGLIICGNVIIPSLFPFGVCVLIFMKCDFIKRTRISAIVAKKLFNQTQDMFLVMVFSMFGGYPVGSRLINELVEQNKINKTTAHIMQCYCVNAGPAFIAIAIGEGVLHSKTKGFLLLSVHLISSLIIAAIFSRLIKQKNIDTIKNDIHKENFSELFVDSAADAAGSVLSVCSFVILFSVINSYFLSLSKRFYIFKVLSLLCEVTTSVTNIKNIYLISFLLGFSGFAVWFQVMSCSRRCGVNFPLFLGGRLLHGAFSCALLYMFLKIFKIKIDTISNSITNSFGFAINNTTVAISLAIMLIMLIISLNGKNHSRNIVSDVL